MSNHFSIIIKDEWSLYRYRNYFYKYLKNNYKLNKFFLYYGKSNIKNSSLIRIIYEINLYLFKQRKKKTIHLIFSVRAIILVGLSCFFYKNHTFVGNFTGLGFSFIGNNLRNKFLKLVIKICLLNYHYIIVQNTKDKIELQKIFKKKIFVTHGSGYKLQDYNQKKFYNNKKINILFASRFIFNKGINDLFNIIKLTNEDKFFFNINLITDYDNKDSCSEKLLKKLQSFSNVKITLNKKLKKDDFTGNDYFLSLSYREGLSRVLLESLNFCLPIIAYSVAGVEELVNKETGFKFPVKKYEMIVNKLDKLSSKYGPKISIKIVKKLLAPYLEKNVLKEYISIINYIEN